MAIIPDDAEDFLAGGDCGVGGAMARMLKRSFQVYSVLR